MHFAHIYREPAFIEIRPGGGHSGDSKIGLSPGFMELLVEKYPEYFSRFA